MADKNEIGCGTIIAGLIVFGMFASAFQGNDKPKSPPNDDTASEACIHAQTIIGHYLKAPSSADYLICTDDVIAATVTHPQEGLWVVRGRVDSENGFGAKLRTYYVIRLTHVSGGVWKEDRPPVFR